MKVNVKELKTIVVVEFLNKYGERYSACYNKSPRTSIEKELTNSCKKFNFSYDNRAEIEYTPFEFMDIIDGCLDDMYDYYFEYFDYIFDDEDNEDETFDDEDNEDETFEDETLEDEGFEDDGEPSLFDKIFNNRVLLTISTSHKISPEDVKHTVNKVHKKHPELTEEVVNDAIDVIIAYLAENETDSKVIFNLNVRDKFNAY